MIGIDTNVILRLIVNDDERQSRAAERFIQENASAESPCYVSNMALIETVWVLESVYGYDREGVADALTMFLDVEQLEFDSAADVSAAIEDYRRERADFEDCMIGRMNLFAGCEYTGTFDRKAARLTGFKLVPAR